MDNDALERDLEIAGIKLKQYTMKYRMLLGVLFAGVLLYTGSTIAHKREVAKATYLGAQVHDLVSQSDEAKAQLASLTSAKDQIDRENVALKNEVDRLRQQVPEMPPEAAKPPAGAAEKVMVLEQLGLAPGLKVTLDPLPSLMGSGDADKAITWGEEALRVPMLTTRIGALESLDDANKKLVQGLTTEKTLGDVALGKCKEALDLESAARKASEDRGTALVKAGKIQSFKLKMTIYVGIPVAAWAGYRLGRR